MREFTILAILLALPFLPWRKIYEAGWDRFQLLVPSAVEQFDTLLRKRWPTIQTRHLFLFSFILTGISVLFFFVGSIFRLSTLPLPVGVMGGILLPFLILYMLKPNIEASFLFEIRLIYTVLRTQITGGATPQEALALVIEVAEILKKDLMEIQLAWSGNVVLTLESISMKYGTDELNLLLSLIREMHQAGTSNQKEVMSSFDDMKEMMQDEISSKEAMSDEKEMEILEISSFAYIGALMFLMVLPVIGDIVGKFTTIDM
jgi:Flp pilus assembly protein TadB